MAEIMEQQLQNLYTVYYQKYDGALLYHDGLYDVRRAYFTSGGKRQKNKVVKEADGVSYRYSYLMERGQPLKWKSWRASGRWKSVNRMPPAGITF